MRQFIAFVFLALLVACGSKKEIAQPVYEPKPAWASSKPIESFYYAGIGMAYKSAGADYSAIAKNNALNDLSSEISVNVSSSSLFYQVEQDQNLREEFQANTRLKSKENLEGYELVGSYENATEFWVYYRLDKSKYEAIKAQRLANAIAISKQLFTNAYQFREGDQYAESIKFTVKAIAALKDYLGEPLQTEWRGQQVFLMVELYSFLQQTLSDIRLKPQSSIISAKRGQAISANHLSFTSTNPNNIPLAGIPEFLYYSGERIQNNQLYTNMYGQVQYTLPRLVSTNSKEYFQANVNMVSLVSEATDDPFVRKLLAKISGPEARIEISVDKPMVYVESIELNMGQAMSIQLLASAFTQNFIDQGFEMTKSKSTADYFLTIDAKTRDSGMQQKFYTAALDATIQFKDAQGILLYERQVQGYMGMQLSASQAGEDAYKKLTVEINKRYFRELRRKVFD